MNIQNIIEDTLKQKGISREDVRQEIVNIFNLLNSTALNAKDISIKQEEELTRWLYGNNVHFISSKKESYNKRDWFINEIDKISYLNQFHCKICNLDGLSIFPIRIKPKSRQTKTQVKNEFQRLISEAPFVKNKTFNSADRICIRMTFIINQSRDKDLDNMAKITLDGLKKVLIPDDKQIDHLELIKFKAKYIEEFISVAIGKSNLNNNNTVIFNGENLNWAGLEKLTIT